MFWLIVRWASRLVFVEHFNLAKGRHPPVSQWHFIRYFNGQLIYFDIWSPHFLSQNALRGEGRKTASLECPSFRHASLLNEKNAMPSLPLIPFLTQSVLDLAVLTKLAVHVLAWHVGVNYLVMECTAPLCGVALLLRCFLYMAVQLGRQNDLADSSNNYLMWESKCEKENIFSSIQRAMWWACWMRSNCPVILCNLCKVRQSLLELCWHGPKFGLSFTTRLMMMSIWFILLRQGRLKCCVAKRCNFGFCRELRLGTPGRLMWRTLSEYWQYRSHLPICPQVHNGVYGENPGVQLATN